MGVRTPSGAPALVATLPPRRLPKSVHFSMATSVHFSVAIASRRGCRPRSRSRTAPRGVPFVGPQTAQACSWPSPRCPRCARRGSLTGRSPVRPCRKGARSGYRGRSILRALPVSRVTRDSRRWPMRARFPIQSPGVSPASVAARPLSTTWIFGVLTSRVPTFRQGVAQ